MAATGTAMAAAAVSLSGDAHQPALAAIGLRPLPHAKVKVRARQGGRHLEPLHTVPAHPISVFHQLGQASRERFWQATSGVSADCVLG